MIDPAGEQAWALDAQAGSSVAFGRLVRAHQQALRVFLRRLTQNHAEADDIAQTAFVFAWETIARFDAQRSFRAWLFGIAWRKFRESRRGLRRMLMRETAYAATGQAEAERDPGAQMDLAAALAALEPEPRAVMILCLAMEFTHQEAAEALNLPLGTVKSHITRTRSKLAGLLGSEP